MMTNSTGGSPAHNGRSHAVDADAATEAADPIDLDVDANTDESQALRDSEQFAVDFLKKVLRLRGARIEAIRG